MTCLQHPAEILHTATVSNRACDKVLQPAGSSSALRKAGIVDFKVLNIGFL